MKGRLFTQAFIKLRYENHLERYTDRVIIPEDQRVVINTMDMYLHCNCANCGKDVLYGDTWSSVEWYDESGVWALPVCRECHEREMRVVLNDNQTAQTDTAVNPSQPDRDQGTGREV